MEFEKECRKSELLAIIKRQKTPINELNRLGSLMMAEMRQYAPLFPPEAQQAIVNALGEIHLPENMVNERDSVVIASYDGM